MNFRKQLQSLITEAHKYQYADISDSKKDIEKKKPRFYFTKVQYGLLFLSALIAGLMNTTFNEGFAGYVVSGLSLFAGLFFSFILMLIDKFQKIDFEPYKEINNAALMPLGVRLKNYYKKSTTLSFYIVLLSLLSILLLSLSLFDIGIDLFSYLKEKVCITFVLEGAKKIILFLYRTTTLYFLLDFLWITLYLITSFYDFIGSEYDKVKLK